MAEIFVSYTGSDRDWADWLARELEELGHKPFVHEWEVAAGDDIYRWMEHRHDTADRVLCVFSDEYLKAPYSTLERNAAFWQAANKRPGFVLPVVVKPCRIPTLSDHLNRCELFALPEDVARQRFRKFMTAPLRPSPAAFPGRAIAVSNITISVPVHFMGREESLTVIRTALGRDQGRIAITALHGLRGLGKTTLAAAYAERHRSDYRATWWIRAQTDTTIRADLVGLGVRLGWVDAEDIEEPAAAKVMERLRHEGEGILLIYDNAVDTKRLRPFLPPGGAARIIVTTNSHDWRSLAEPIDIGLWPASVGADYLLARTAGRAERSSVEELSKALGGLPLAHEHAAAYCEYLDVPLPEYHRRLAAEPVRMLDKGKYASADYRDGLTVVATFNLAIQEAAKKHPAAEPLLLSAALLAPEPIPLFLFRESGEALGQPIATQLRGDGLDEAVAALRTFALVERGEISDEREPTVTTPSIRLHRLVRDIAAARMSIAIRDDRLQSLLAASVAVFPPYVYRDSATWLRVRRIEPIALALLEALSRIANGPNRLLYQLANRLGSYKQSALADYTEAERLLRLAVSFAGDWSVDALNNLVNLLMVKNDIHQARPVLEHVLSVYVRRHGPDDPKTVVPLSHLAHVYEELGDLDKACELLQRALDIREAKLGPCHEDTSTSLHNLASMLGRLHRYDRALPLIQRALVIRQNKLGRNHLWTVSSLCVIAGFLLNWGDAAGAESLFRQALAVQEGELGGDHPDTKRTARNLTAALVSMGRPQDAAVIRERYGLT